MKGGRSEMPCFIRKKKETHDIQHSSSSSEVPNRIFHRTQGISTERRTTVHGKAIYFVVMNLNSEHRTEVNRQRSRFLCRSKAAKARKLRNLSILSNRNWDGCRDAMFQKKSTSRTPKLPLSVLLLKLRILKPVTLFL
jgi:hypothetical protein